MQEIRKTTTTLKNKTWPSYPSMCPGRLFKDDTTASIYVASPQAIQELLHL